MIFHHRIRRGGIRVEQRVVMMPTVALCSAGDAGNPNIAGACVKDDPEKLRWRANADRPHILVVRVVF